MTASGRPSAAARPAQVTAAPSPARRTDGLRAVGAAAFLIARRARRDLVALLGILVLTALTAALAVAVPHQLRTTLDAAAVEAVSAAGSDADLRLLSTVADVSGYDTTTSERLLTLADELPERLPAPLLDVVRSIDTAILGPEEPARIPAGDAVVRVGVLDPAAADGVRLVAGALPAEEDPGDPAPVVVSSASAAAAGLSVGDAIDGASRGGGPSLRITGVIEPVDPSAAAWTDLPGLWQPGTSGSSGGEPQPVVVALTSPVVFDRIGLLLQEPAVGTIRVSVEPARFDLARTETVRREIDALETSTSTITEGAPLSVAAESGYEEALAALPPAAAAATAQLSTLAAGLLGVAVLVTGLASTALTRRRRPEIALLRSHGASLGLLGSHAGVEALILTALGAALGLATAAALGAPPESPGLLIAVAGVLVVAPVVAVLRPLLRPPRRIRVLRLAGAGLLLALAVIAVAALRGGARSSGGVDPLALVAPVLCAAVIALALAPLPAALLAPLRRAAAGMRGPGPLLAGAGAQEGRSLLTLATLVLAASTALTSLVLLQTVAAGQESLSWRTVGADVRVDDAAAGPALAASLADGGAVTAAIGALDAVEVRSPTASLTATVLSVDDDYADLLAALPDDQPQHASAEAVRALVATGPAEPVPVLVDARLAASLGTAPFGLEVDGALLQAVVTGEPVAGPDRIDTSVVVVDREALTAAVTAAGGDSPAPPGTVLAVGAVDRAALPDGTILRSDVLERQRDSALVAGVADATGLSLLATAALAVLALLVTTVLGARRRGGTLALLSALGVPGRARLVLAAGELVPAVLSGVVGGAVAAAVVLAAAWPAFGVETLVGGDAALSIPWPLPVGLLGAAVAALALALAVDAPLSRRVRTADILRSGEES
ncbi:MULTISPECIES: hypothetical protein [unclassified Rathayibacter]|uniref:hypothetical protein n=1 Tax=unclassified Rathayibacter TaxID=2609250 RepID=UPI000F4B29A2|nr:MULTISPECIES: hypothetical protein [unclassified Rathayibacter]ROP45191.1 hypothetical protein EDF45_3710 [Rathayibacter sp. PhB186]ROS47771.1 hypothetical protein EDF44_3604 [Rathayibacter sp. PhB185]